MWVDIWAKQVAQRHTRTSYAQSEPSSNTATILAHSVSKNAVASPRGSVSSAGSRSSQACGILFQQALAFQAAANASTDQLNQILQLAFIRCFDPPEARRVAVAVYIDAIQEQNVKVDIQV
jgi:hypothetical protein